MYAYIYVNIMLNRVGHMSRKSGKCHEKMYVPHTFYQSPVYKLHVHTYICNFYTCTMQGIYTSMLHVFDYAFSNT